MQLEHYAWEYDNRGTLRNGSGDQAQVQETGAVWQEGDALTLCCDFAARTVAFARNHEHVGELSGLHGHVCVYVRACVSDLRVRLRPSYEMLALL